MVRLDLRRPSLDWLLVFVPISLVTRYALHRPLATFVTSALAIVPLAGLIGRSTPGSASEGCSTRPSGTSPS